jgi:type VI secretion system protein VasI
LASAARDCPRIVSNLERLACFDEAAGTPARSATRTWSAPEQEAPSVLSVSLNEVQRAADDWGFLLTAQDEDGEGLSRLVISAPAIASAKPHPVLAISCVQNISRLQLITGQPLDTHRLDVRLFKDETPVSSGPWQVQENGRVLDAGRGLPAIDQIKRLIGAQRIHLISEHPVVGNLSFDAVGLSPLIAEARKACRW